MQLQTCWLVFLLSFAVYLFAPVAAAEETGGLAGPFLRSTEIDTESALVHESLVADEHGESSVERSLEGITDEDDSTVTLDGFLSSLYVNLVLFVFLMLFISWLRRWMPEFFSPRSYGVDDNGAVYRLELPEPENDDYDPRYLGTSNAASQSKTRNDGYGPPPIPEKWCGLYWIYFVSGIPLKTVLDTVGLDAYMFLRFTQRAAQLFGIVCTVLGCGIILPINLTHGESDTRQFADLSLAKIKSRDTILWVHAASVWLFTFATFAILLELGREFAFLRHRYLRYNLYHRTTNVGSKRQSSETNQSENNSNSSARETVTSCAMEHSSTADMKMTERRLARSTNSAVPSEGTGSRSSHKRKGSHAQVIPPWLTHEENEEPNAPYVKNPRPYTVMVQNLPAWINCDAQLYFYFDYLFPGEVHCASLVTFAEKLDNLFYDRNSMLRLLERKDRLQKKYGGIDDGVSSKATGEAKDEDNSGNFHAQEKELDDTQMVLFPKGMQWFTDCCCCGPFYETLCCGCYQKCFGCCDDKGEHEEDVIKELGDEYGSDDESSDEESRGSSRSRGKTSQTPVHPVTRTGCCTRARRVHAQQYLSTALDIATRKLELWRCRGRHQNRRRASEDLIGAPVQTQQKETNEGQNEVASHMETDNDDNDSKGPVRRHRPSSSVSAAASNDNTSGRKLTQVGKTVYDRVAFTTEVLTGVDWRTRFSQLENSSGFRPSSTGFVTFKTMTAVSEAVQMTLVPERAVFDPVLAKNAHTEDVVADWTDNEAVQLAKSVTTHIFSPFKAVGEVMDITRYQTMKAIRAPGPEDILWAHVTVKEQLRQSRKWTTFWITLLLQFLYTALVSAVSSLVTLRNLSKVWPGIGDFAQEHSFVQGLITGLLPTIIIESILALLPIVFEWFGYLEYRQTYSEISMSASNKFFQFKTWQLMFVFVVSGTIVDTISDILKNPQRIVNLLGASLPRLSSFYINLLVLRTLTMLPLQMLRPWWLLLHYLAYRRDMVLPSSYTSRQQAGHDYHKNPLLPADAEHGGVERKPENERKHTWQYWDMTRREYWENVLIYNADFYWIFHFTNSLLAFLMGITYSSINPIIAPVAAAFFWNASFVWKYMILYVHQKSWESGGLIWPKMARRINVSLIVYQLTMLGVLGLKQSTSTALVFPLLFVTWLFDRFIQKYLEQPAMRLSKEESRQIDDSFPESSNIGDGQPVFWSVDELRRTRFPEKAKAMCSYSAYVRPSLDRSNDWKPHSVSTKNVLYY